MVCRCPHWSYCFSMISDTRAGAMVAMSQAVAHAKLMHSRHTYSPWHATAARPMVGLERLWVHDVYEVLLLRNVELGQTAYHS